VEPLFQIYDIESALRAFSVSNDLIGTSHIMASVHAYAEDDCRYTADAVSRHGYGLLGSDSLTAAYSKMQAIYNGCGKIP
jgi:hypothetical protein